jgi:magnesium-transporting ATPase (P-type)
VAARRPYTTTAERHQPQHTHTTLPYTPTHPQPLTPDDTGNRPDLKPCCPCQHKAAAMAAMAPPWTRSAQGALDDLQTSLQGLSAEEVELRRQQHGFNELQKEPGKPMWRLILEQFDDMLVKVGCVAVWSEW